MQEYHNFFGIDIAKEDFVVAHYGHSKVKTYANNADGIAQFVNELNFDPHKSLFVLETTGGYEWKMVTYFFERNIPIHRADTVKVKHYIRSLRRYGKTDAIDARGLANYAYHRHQSLNLFRVPEARQQKLQQLIRRRDELIQMRTQETNRLKCPSSEFINDTFTEMLSALDSVINRIENDINDLIKLDSTYKAKKEIMIAMPGIADKTANKLLALMPELGLLSRKEIAHLAGVAPHPHDSGKLHVYRKTRGGRPDVKKALYMAAMSALQSKGKLGDFYRNLVSQGKKPIVAMVALMRKMIVILNAQIRDFMIHQKLIKQPVLGNV